MLSNKTNLLEEADRLAVQSALSSSTIDSSDNSLLQDQVDSIEETIIYLNTSMVSQNLYFDWQKHACIDERTRAHEFFWKPLLRTWINIGYACAPLFACCFAILRIIIIQISYATYLDYCVKAEIKERQSGLGNEEKILMLHKEYQKLDKKLEDIARTVEQNQLEDCFFLFIFTHSYLDTVNF